MDRVFVDANVFMRFFTKDDEGQEAKAKKLFLKAQAGKLRLFTGPPVLFEIAWTLKARYKLKNAEILDILESLLTTAWLDISDKDLAEEAVNVARVSGQDYADAYIHVSIRKVEATGIAAFNRKHFDKMGTRLVDL
jgi:predicted nucleic-acid-binding protein